MYIHMYNPKPQTLTPILQRASANHYLLPNSEFCNSQSQPGLHLSVRGCCD